MLDYLSRTDQASPELHRQAEDLAVRGYQKLLTFQTQDGGFSLWPDQTPDRMLTAYGLQLLYDIGRVYPVDPQVAERATSWLMDQQMEDGSWANDQGLVHETIWSSLPNPRLPVTAYVVWGLVESGFGQDERAQRGLSYVREHWAEAEDAYVLAIVANALVAADPAGQITQRALDRLDGIQQRDGEHVYWSSDSASFMGATGNSASIETTALAAFALMRAGQHLDSAQGALDFLISVKDSHGTWGTTQATILSLKALLLSTQVGGAVTGDATVYVILNDQTVATLEISAEQPDLVHQVVIERGIGPGAGELALEIEGESNLMAQVTTAYYLPWSQVPVARQTEQGPEIEVTYDRTTLAVGEQITATAHVVWRGSGGARMLMLDLGLPPGFNVLNQDLNALVVSGQIRRYESTGQGVLIYLENFSAETPLTFSYQLQARFPMRAQTSDYEAYDYYNPDQRAGQAPVRVVVTE